MKGSTSFYAFQNLFFSVSIEIEIRLENVLILKSIKIIDQIAAVSRFIWIDMMMRWGAANAFEIL